LACLYSFVSRSAKLLLFMFILVQAGCKIGGPKPWTGWWTPGDSVDNVGYKPDQPIPFPHDLHAGEKKIPCQYCHSSARRSHVAGVPPLNTCMGCHRYVATDKEPIKYLTAKYEANEPVKWTKVHDIPDYVRFTHQPHVLAGVGCESCHGDVKKMGVAAQAKPLQMGWCIECHLENEVPVSCSTCHY